MATNAPTWALHLSITAAIISDRFTSAQLLWRRNCDLMYEVLNVPIRALKTFVARCVAVFAPMPLHLVTASVAAIMSSVIRSSWW